MYEANVIGPRTRFGPPSRRRSVASSTYPRWCVGNTKGQVVTSPTEHPHGGYTSYYEETKVEAHRLAKRLISEQGLPCVIVQPGGVYGPEDHSAIGRQMNQFLDGRMPLIAFPDLGMNLVHVDDVADGVVLALDDGKPGESYVLGGQIATMRELIETLVGSSDRKAAEARPADLA